MRRWNGWGDDRQDYPLPDAAAAFLAGHVGEGERLPDATWEQALAGVPPGRLPPHPLVLDDPAERLRHSRGQSLPDWIALRSGRIGAYPDGVAYPVTSEQARALLAYAYQSGACLIPYGAGTSVVGHINPQPVAGPALTVDLSRFNRLLDLDEISRLATFEAGVSGPELERQLRERGYTLGHYPQSFEYSTLGGWIATRSSGQQSYHYGRIEDLFAGGEVETPRGSLVLPCYPASGAGPDLRQVWLGSEGRLGVITRATVRIRPAPRRERFYGIVFRDWEAGARAVRTIAQARVGVSMLRLSDADETETTLRLAGHAGRLAWAERGLRLFGYGAGRCLLLLGITEDSPAGARARGEAVRLAREAGGLATGTFAGEAWRKGRFKAPYLRNTLWERGYALDTLETALPWSKVLPATAAVKAALGTGLEYCGERVWVMAHLSHVYVDGVSLYVTYLFRRTADPDATLERWQRLKAAASQLIGAHGGTISHQHGVGTDHAPYMLAEKGRLGLDAIAAVARAVDPEQRLNPGKLLPEAGADAE